MICKSENNQISKVVFRNHDNDDVTPCDELIDDKVALVIEKKTFDLKSKLSDESDSYHHVSVDDVITCSPHQFPFFSF